MRAIKCSRFVYLTTVIITKYHLAVRYLQHSNILALIALSRYRNGHCCCPCHRPNSILEHQASPHKLTLPILVFQIHCGQLLFKHQTNFSISIGVFAHLFNSGPAKLDCHVHLLKFWSPAGKNVHLSTHLDYLTTPINDETYDLAFCHALCAANHTSLQHLIVNVMGIVSRSLQKGTELSRRVRVLYQLCWSWSKYELIMKADRRWLTPTKTLSATLTTLTSHKLKHV